MYKDKTVLKYLSSYKIVPCKCISSVCVWYKESVKYDLFFDDQDVFECLKCGLTITRFDRWRDLGE